MFSDFFFRNHLHNYLHSLWSVTLCIKGLYSFEWTVLNQRWVASALINYSHTLPCIRVNELCNNYAIFEVQENYIPLETNVPIQNSCTEGIWWDGRYVRSVQLLWERTHFIYNCAVTADNFKGRITNIYS